MLFFRRLKRLHELGEKEILHKLSRFSALNDAMLNFMTNTLPLFAFALGLLFTKTGQMTTGETIAIMLVSQKLNEPIILLAALILDKRMPGGYMKEFRIFMRAVRFKMGNGTWHHLRVCRSG